MNSSSHTTHPVVIVGGGFAGLATAVRLAQAGLSVSLLERGKLGHDASTRNQGWLHSGAVFARIHPELARMCYQSLLHTVDFCPDCIEPQHGQMVYIISKPDTLASKWTDAWTQIGIPWEQYDLNQLFEECPGLSRDHVQHAFLLPDRSMRPDVLLSSLAAVAENAGVEIRTDTAVSELMHSNGMVTGVKTAAGEEVSSSLVILAGGSTGTALHSSLSGAKVGCQEDCMLVPLKTHLVAVKPELGSLPFCVIDEGGFNHLPHASRSVFGSNLWTPVADPADQQADTSSVQKVWDLMSRFFPGHKWDRYETFEWAGTTIQAMHLEQVTPGEVPLPTVVDHQEEAPCLENFISLFPGRATLWAHLAEDACKLVLEKLEHASSRTATPPWAEK